MLRYILGCLVVLDAALIVASAEAVDKCYICNSIEDSNCEKSDSEALKKYNKPCESQDGKKPTACRKIVQQVEETPQRIIRECAYSGDDKVDGVRKQGNKGIKMLYYQCPLDKSKEQPCNGASLPLASIISVAVCAFLMIRI